MSKAPPVKKKSLPKIRLLPVSLKILNLEKPRLSHFHVKCILMSIELMLLMYVVNTYRTIKTQSYQHKEEDNGPKNRTI